MLPINDIKKIAKRSDHKWAHHVAFLVQSNVIVSVGYNKREMHAEEMALRKMKLSGERANWIYSLRVRRDGRLGASKPCENCQRMIREAGVGTVYYHDYDGTEQRMFL